MGKIKVVKLRLPKDLVLQIEVVEPADVAGQSAKSSAEFCTVKEMGPETVGMDICCGSGSCNYRCK